MPVVVLSSSGSGASRGSSENISFRLHKEQLDQFGRRPKKNELA